MNPLILQADARAIPLPDGYVQCVVTSPPYWRLRDYGTARWIGGDAACDHRHETAHQKQGTTSQRAGRTNVEAQRNENFRTFCARCGALRTDSQIGLEPTPEAYVASLVQVFREVWRVLRDDGTVWLNLGDSYASHPGQRKTTDSVGAKQLTNAGSNTTPSRHVESLKAKDLVGIPWRVAFALQADGWYLRSDIIWAKPNPMPESVTDRPTRSHEYLFLLTKAERYYYDAFAVRETSVREATSGKGSGQKIRKLAGHAEGHRVDDHLESSVPWEPDGSGRNRRSVWTITPKPYRGAHFATFPPELVEPCIRAGTPEGGCCCMCGAPFLRVVEKGEARRAQQIACGALADGTYGGVAQKDYDAAGAQDASATKARILAGMGRTVGWKLTCTCSPTAAAASIVLDPFAGSGTTGQVAKALGRIAVLLDLKFDYLRLCQERTK